MNNKLQVITYFSKAVRSVLIIMTAFLLCAVLFSPCGWAVVQYKRPGVAEFYELIYKQSVISPCSDCAPLFLFPKNAQIPAIVDIQYNYLQTPFFTSDRANNFKVHRGRFFDITDQLSDKFFVGSVGDHDVYIRDERSLVQINGGDPTRVSENSLVIDSNDCGWTSHNKIGNVYYDDNKSLFFVQKGNPSYGHLSFDDYKGIHVITLAFDRIDIDGRKIPVTFRSSLNEHYLLAHPVACGEFGQYSQRIELVLVPGSEGKLRQWARQHKRDFGVDILDREPGDAINEREIVVWVGMEDAARTLLLAQDWVLDASRPAIPSGPSGIFIQFDRGRVLFQHANQKTVGSNLIEALRNMFPLLSFDELHFNTESGGGYFYNWLIFDKTEKIGIDHEYNGRWLRANLQIRLYRVVNDKGDDLDQIEIQIKDGYLPKWPEDSPPSMEFLRQFHLADEASPPLDFGSLEQLQKKIAAGLQSRWGGTILED